MKRKTIKRIAVNTGGGDAPGLNAVISSVVMAADKLGWEIYGINEGYTGLIDGKGIRRLRPKDVQYISHLGGTILGTTNKGNPFQVPGVIDGEIVMKDVSKQVVRNFKKHKFDALIAIGGDGSLNIAQKLVELGMPIVGVPKTIDNDISGTSTTFGFATAVSVATEAIDRLHSTAKAHDRVMVVEVMGRNAGWIALYAGIASQAHIILIPEIDFKLENVYAKIKSRYKKRDGYAIVVVSEGAKPYGFKNEFHIKRSGSLRLGGVGEFMETQIYEATGKETRSLVLGHLLRGGTPCSQDRVLALRFGAAAVRAVADGKSGCMVALRPPNIIEVPLKNAISKLKTVPLKGDLIQTVRDMGICLGDAKVV
ncbi:6-phosphofructokinase [Planctomycetota bacterium]